ncbi:MAG: hypothetical protein QG552_1127 [Thermodesulfobacteriota bacterium]|nr:hypothetical protein [Thermodesulfobacteriota bacterium]
MKLNHVALVASSQEHADRFYEGLLKLKKIKVSRLTRDLAVQVFGFDLECPFILYGNEQFGLEVFVTDQMAVGSMTVSHICLQVEDREAFITECRSAGVEVLLIPRGESQLCFVRDLDGNLFEIK